MTAARLRRGVGDDLRAALPAWIAARVLVAIGYAMARLWRELDDPERLTIQLHQGLFAWDGAFYREIASQGYDALPDQALRFFPLYPLSGRGLGFLLGGNEGIALLLIANVAALANRGVIAAQAGRIAEARAYFRRGRASPGCGRACAAW